MDTDHPIFQCQPPAYLDSPEDEFAERVALRWARESAVSRSAALQIAKDEFAAAYKPFRNLGGVDGDWSKISALMAYVYDSASPLLTLDCICYCFGLIRVNGEPMQRLAEKHGISRQAFSKQVLTVRRELGLPATGNMRSLEQRENYQAVQNDRWQMIIRFKPRKKP